jgi:hypothetical protein
VSEAAEALTLAAGILTEEGRLSIKALEYYQAAAELSADWQDTQRIDHLSAELATVWKERLATVALVANVHDQEFADLLVDPLARESVACRFEAPDCVSDLAKLVSYDAIIVIGGIMASDTDYHLNQYFYEVPSLTHQLSFKTIDAASARQSYCDFWLLEIGGKPVYVLAGAIREETCQAVLRFIQDPEFRRLTARVVLDGITSVTPPEQVATSGR